MLPLCRFTILIVLRSVCLSQIGDPIVELVAINVINAFFWEFSIDI